MYDDENEDRNEHENGFQLLNLIHEYEEAVRNQQHIFYDHDKYEQIIDFYEDNHKKDIALQVVSTALEQYPYSSTFMIRKAQLLIDKRQFEEAKEWIDKATLLDGEDISICLTKADLFVWQGMHHEAIKLVKEFIEKADEDDKEDLYLELADIYEDCERYDKVIYCLKMAVSFNQESEEGLNRLWFCTELLENYELMIDFYKELLDKNPYNVLAWFNLAHCYVGIDLWEKAIEAFEYVMAIDDKFEDAYVDCADIYFNLKNYKKAIELYLSANTLVRVSKEVYFQVGLCYEKLKEPNRARTYYRKALTVDAEYDEAFYRIGESYKSEKRFKEATSSFQRAIKIYPENVYYHKALAETHLELKDYEEAIAAYKDIIEMDGSKKWQWIDLATAYYSNNNPVDALDTIEEAILRFKKKTELIYAKSALLYNVGRRKESIENLELALSLKFKLHSIIFAISNQMKYDQEIVHLIDQYKN